MPITQDRILTLLDIAQRAIHELASNRDQIARLLLDVRQGTLPAENALVAIESVIFTSALGPTDGEVIGREEAHFGKNARVNDKSRIRAQLWRLRKGAAAVPTAVPTANMIRGQLGLEAEPEIGVEDLPLDLNTEHSSDAFAKDRGPRPQG